MDKIRKFARFCNAQTDVTNTVYLEIEDGVVKFIAAVSPKKNNIGKYEVFCEPYSGKGKMTFTDTEEEAKEAILEYFNEQEKIISAN